MNSQLIDEALLYISLLGLTIITPLTAASVYYWRANILTVNVAIGGALAFVLTFLLPMVAFGLRKVAEEPM